VGQREGVRIRTGIGAGRTDGAGGLLAKDLTREEGREEEEEAASARERATSARMSRGREGYVGEPGQYCSSKQQEKTDSRTS